MKALILAAGFGTRLEKSLDHYEGSCKKEFTAWVSGKPKGLIPVSGKPMVSHQLEQLTQVGVKLKDVYVQTNQCFYSQYIDWAVSSGIPSQNVFNNGVSKNEERKEQVQDLLLAIEKIGYKKPLFVFASDTLVYGADNKLLKLSPLIKIYEQGGFPSVVAYYKEKEASNHGVITIGRENKIASFQEKPQNIGSGWVNASVYFFTPNKLKQMIDLSKELSSYKNPLQLVWDGFKIVPAIRRIDLGTIEDLLRAEDTKR